MLPAHQMDLITSGFVPSRRAMGAAAVFDGVDLLPSGHGIPTDRCQVPPCVPCAENQSPFLVACNWDGAGHALQWMLGGGRAKLAPRAARSDPHAWSYFDQRPFGPSSPFSVFRTRMTAYYPYRVETGPHFAPG